MELLFIAAIVGAISFYAGWKSREAHAVRVMDKLTKEFSDNMLEDLKSKVINVKIEEVGEDIFVYDESGTYLAHGPSMKKLEEILSDKFPGKLFNSSPEDLEKLKAR